MTSRFLPAMRRTGPPPSKRLPEIASTLTTAKLARKLPHFPNGTLKSAILAPHSLAGHALHTILYSVGLPSCSGRLLAGVAITHFRNRCATQQQILDFVCGLPSFARSGITPQDLNLDDFDSLEDTGYRAAFCLLRSVKDYLDKEAGTFEGDFVPEGYIAPKRSDEQDWEAWRQHMDLDRKHDEDEGPCDFEGDEPVDDLAIYPPQDTFTGPSIYKHRLRVGRENDIFAVLYDEKKDAKHAATFNWNGLPNELKTKIIHHVYDYPGTLQVRASVGSQDPSTARSLPYQYEVIMKAPKCLVPSGYTPWYDERDHPRLDLWKMEPVAKILAPRLVNKYFNKFCMEGFFANKFEVRNPVYMVTSKDQLAKTLFCPRPVVPSWLALLSKTSLPNEVQAHYLKSLKVDIEPYIEGYDWMTYVQTVRCIAHLPKLERLVWGIDIRFIQRKERAGLNAPPLALPWFPAAGSFRAKKLNIFIPRARRV